MARIVPCFEKKQRGCIYCIHSTRKIRRGENRTACPFGECPYTVLDKYNTYEEFMASEDSKILVEQFFSTVASVYDLSMPRTPKKVFSDGDSRMHL